ncbi:MAG: GH39 family glycosyl hydrolase [Pseudomonadota bacterium]
MRNAPRLLAALAAIAVLAAASLAHAEPRPARVEIGPPVAGAAPDVYAFGGGVWRVPKVMRLAEPLLEELGKGGTWRVALAWEALAPSADPADLARRLERHPLNAFLAARAAEGGEVLVTLDAMPRWLSREDSEEKQGDAPAWALAPPRSQEGWAEVVETVVRHYNGALGLDAVYEVWNEPDHAFRGTLDDYVALYRASALGARRADPAARLAGPALSDWASPAPGGGRPWIAAFLEAAARTPIPELGLSRLPVDVLTAHAFYRDPGVHFRRLHDAWSRAAEAAGYGGAPIWISEWSAVATPPYPEGDLNGTAYGAAYAAASLTEMAAAGIARQTWQMAIDPGTEGYSAGALTAQGVPRPVFHAFRFVARAARGQALSATADAPFLHAAAFRHDGRLAMLLAHLLPTDVMLARAAFEDLAWSDPATFAAINALGSARLERILIEGAAPPEGPLAAPLRAGREAFVARRDVRARWSDGARVSLAPPGPGWRPSLHEAVDRARAPGPDRLARQGERVVAALREGLERAERRMREAGLLDGPGRTYAEEVDARLDGRAALAAAPGPLASRLAEIDALWVEPARAAMAEARRAGAAGLAVSGSSRPDGTLEFEMAPDSVHLILFERAQ